MRARENICDEAFEGETSEARRGGKDRYGKLSYGFSLQVSSWVGFTDIKSITSKRATPRTCVLTTYAQ